MLNTIFLSNFFIKSINLGFYIDYWFKSKLKIFIYNFLIWNSIFFAEKFLIEHLSKIIFSKLNLILVNKNSMYLNNINYLMIFIYQLLLLIYILF